MTDDRRREDEPAPEEFEPFEDEEDDFEEGDFEEGPSDEGQWREPAPVVTDDGVYGRLPPRPLSYDEFEREYRRTERRERTMRDTGMRLAAVAFAITAALWLIVISGREATSEQVARPAQESLLDAMLGLSGLLELHATEISAAAEDAAVPGFPLPVTIPTEEIGSGPDRWREVLLERGGQLLYEEGPGALSEGASTGGGGTFSTASGAKLLMSNLTDSRHTTLAFLVWPLALAALASAVAVVVLGSSFGRFVALGLATAAAGIPALGLGALAWAMVAFVGSDGSTLAETSHRVASELAWLPLRNGLTFFLGGVAIVIAARVVGAVFRPAVERRPAYEE